MPSASGMALCNDATLSSPQDSCIRGFWTSVIPFVFLIIILPLHATAKRLRPAGLFTLEEAEVLISGENDVGKEAPTVPLWRTLLLSTVSLLECSAWIATACYALITPPVNFLDGVLHFLVATTWLYALLRPVVQPLVSVPYDLLSLFVAHFACATVVFVGYLYDRYVLAAPIEPLILAANAVNIAAISVALAVIMNMPLGMPSTRVRKEDIGKTVSPEDYTTVWGWVTFRWFVPLLELGSSKTLEEDDVWSVSPLLQARPLHLRLSRSIGTLLRKLWAAHHVELFLDIVLTWMSVGFSYSGPYFLKQILDTLSDTQQSREKRATAYVYALLAFVGKFCQAQVDVQRLYTSRRASGRVRSELMASIYDKALRRRDVSGTIVQKPSATTPGGKAQDPNSKSGADIGKIVNLMAGDASRIANFVAYMYFIYQCPFDIVIASIFLYRLMGWSAFAGIFVLSLSWPLNRFVGKSSINVQKGLSAARDQRMGILSELISAVKFIKFFAWEERWIKRVSDSREVELNWLVRERINSLLFSFIWTSVPILVSVSSFFVYVAQGNELNIGTAFTAIALFQNLRQPFNGIPTWFVQLFQSKVALDRISTYLDEEEVDEQVSALKKGHVPPSEDTASGLGIEHGTFIWNATKDQPRSGENAEQPNGTDGTNDRRFELKDIDVMLPDGRLTVVTGPTASGKTALLMALLGELTMLKGRLIMSKNPSKVDEHGLAHTISYAAQTPWLRHESIRDNILFGHPYDELRYNAVVECCALRPDLEILEDGDATEIGARGVSLSGGQKARVALARAVYAPTKFVLLDDPLSAVDSHTARFLYERLLKGSLLAHRTVVLVTHHVELVLPGAHYLIRMADGCIDIQGEVAALRASGKLDDLAQGEENAVHQDESVSTTKTDAERGVGTRAERKGRKPRKLIEDERRETGSVKWPIYKTYLKAASYWTWAALVILLMLSQGLGVGEKLWIKVWGEAYGNSLGGPTETIPQYWSSSEEQHPLDVGSQSLYHSFAAYNRTTATDVTATALPSAQSNPYFYVGVYAAISLATVLVRIIAVGTQYTGALRASRILFERLLRSVVRATMRWHDVTPQGRMLNRFSKDIETIDTSLAGSLQSVNNSLASFAVSMITIMVIFPLFIVPGSILGYLYRRASILYLNTGRDVQRMESNTRSPIFATFSEVLEGIVTVRAFGAEQRFLDDMYRQIDLTTRMWWTFWMMNRWVSLMFDLLGAAGTLATTLFALAGYVDAGLAGVCITSAMSFSVSTYWICRNWTALELELNSVERVVEYLQLPQEPPAIIESNRPPAYWPSSTNKDDMLVVEDLVIRYAPDLPEVLHGVSFSLKAGERVGLLGRTGSGKSTLAMSLLRFVDPARGRIIIDGIDITTIGVQDLRSHITFIPQDAVLFSGTIRDNIDPFGEYTDHECLDVLHRVQLLKISRESAQITSDTPSASALQSTAEREGEGAIATITLDTQVSPGGANFSQGQRQLVAMARALLRRSKIIVLDEATSSIDFATDAKIQAAIRKEFGDSLLLTVAHRLRTVIDYDRLVVLDEGRVVEFDTPLNLIQKPGGVFRNMCQKSGIYAELEAIARTKTSRDQKDKDL